MIELFIRLALNYITQGPNLQNTSVDKYLIYLLLWKFDQDELLMKTLETPKSFAVIIARNRFSVNKLASLLVLTESAKTKREAKGQNSLKLGVF